jgi:hypothetical protein
MSTDRSLWVIGDIHGMLDPLVVLLNTIRSIEYMRERQVTLVFLGDYIDHGPCSREVVDALLDLRREFGVVFLAGNHEDMLMQFMEPDPGFEDYGKAWFTGNGGQATVCSFMNSRGVLSRLWMRSGSSPVFAAAELRLDREYIEFLHALVYTHTEDLQVGDQLLHLAFSHASLYRRSDCRLQPNSDDPEISVAEQLAVKTRRDFQNLLRRHPMWLDNYHIWNREIPREKFGDLLLLHGHTPTSIVGTLHPGRLPGFDPNSNLPLVIFPEGRAVPTQLSEGEVRYGANLRDAISFNIDTGGVYGHALTAVNFSSSRLREDGRVGVIQVHPGWTHREFAACSRFHLQFAGV